jgi:hypothetical protein
LTILRLDGAVGFVEAVWVTETLFPATVSVVERPVVAVFATTVYDAVPLPVPEADIATHVTGVDDDQAQPACVDTVNDAVPPAAPAEMVVGVTV